jgi:hypothetical protein
VPRSSSGLLEQAQRDLEVSLEVASKALQNDQVIIAGKEVELNDLKNAAHFAMDILASQVEGGGAQAFYRLSSGCARKASRPYKATSLAVATEALIQVKSHNPNVDMVKFGEGPDTTKYPKVVEL